MRYIHKFRVIKNLSQNNFLQTKFNLFYIHLFSYAPVQYHCFLYFHFKLPHSPLTFYYHRYFKNWKIWMKEMNCWFCRSGGAEFRYTFSFIYFIYLSKEMKSGSFIKKHSSINSELFYLQNFIFCFRTNYYRNENFMI